jgi:predicted hotdog family 3-hydroxylacyl-ACP dehydratase
VDVHAAAFKHGVSAEDGTYAAQHAAYVAYLDDDSPSRQLRLGFDSSGRLLEVVVLVFDSGNELLIHAMKARAEYLDLLQ